MYKFLPALAVLSAALPCLTQTRPVPTVTKATLASSYTDETAVFERADVVYRYAGDGTGSKLETGVVRVQSNAALQSLAVLSFSYASGNQRLDIVYARGPVGAKSTSEHINKTRSWKFEMAEWVLL